MKDSEIRQTPAVTPLWETIKTPHCAGTGALSSPRAHYVIISLQEAGKWVPKQKTNTQRFHGCAVSTQMSESGAGSDPALMMSSKVSHDVT